MTSLILSILANAISSIYNFISWMNEQRLVDLGSRVQVAKILEEEIKDDIKITQIRDQSFSDFDSSIASGRLPNDAKIRD